MHVLFNCIVIIKLCDIAENLVQHDLMKHVDVDSFYKKKLIKIF